MDLVERLGDGLVCCIDWLSFTIDTLDIVGVLSDFGFTMDDFFPCPRGANGYKKMLTLTGSSVRVLYDGAENMGIHFDVPSSGIADFLAFYRKANLVDTPWGTKAVDMDFVCLKDLFNRVMSLGHFTRIDLAIDNIDKIYFRVQELVEILSLGRFTSKFRSWREVREERTDGVSTGHTVYLGSRTSEIMLRVYDKRLEQNKKENRINYEWVRWELELKGDRACQAVRALIDNGSVGKICVGILSNYIRLINIDNSNKSRCSSDIKWSEFIGDIESVALYIPKPEKTLDDKYNWFVRQVAPTLTGLIIAKYGDISFISDNMEIQAGRMNSNLRSLVSQAHPNWQKCFDAFGT